MPTGLDDDLHAALAASRTGTWRWDVATGVVRWDQTLEELSGLVPGTFGSTFEAWLATLHPDEVDGILAQVNDAIERRSSYHFEHRAMWPDGTERWLECRGQVTTDADGAFTGTVGCAVDITHRRILEADRVRVLERERRLRDRLEFLVSLTDAATGAADHEALMRTAAAVAVPKLGDWCAIHFVPERGAEMEVVVAHADPTKVAWADALAERYPYNNRADNGIAAVIRNGRTEFIERVDAEMLEDAARNSSMDPAEAKIMLAELHLTSVITAPLTSRRGTVGAMQFVSAESGRVYDRDDVALAEVTASRIADALENLWLAEQHQHISATLQRSLLPPALPTVPGVEVVVRYWPAGEAVEAGGDFYDLFATAPDQWSLLIGDVCGTGPDAAAVTGIARHTVRAAARHGQDHRGVLEWLNEAMLHSNRNRFCTAVYGTLGIAAGKWRIATATGGHPLPVLVRPDGEAELLGGPGSLLGVFDELKVTVGVTDLDVGDVVVFYTDGLTDLPPPFGLSEDEMTALVQDIVPGRSAEAIAGTIHRSLMDRLPEAQWMDDVALLILRVTAPPAPRPDLG